MRNVARLPDSDRGELFRNTADKMGLNDAIVEKDFWICSMVVFLLFTQGWMHSEIWKEVSICCSSFIIHDADCLTGCKVAGFSATE